MLVQKNAGKGTFSNLGTGPRGTAFRGANSTIISKKGAFSALDNSKSSSVIIILIKRF